MTQPEPVPDPTPGWRAALLRQVTHLSAEHSRITQLGPSGYDGTDADAEDDWQHHLDSLAGERERTEQVALSAGIPAEVITQARNPAHGDNPPAPPPLPHESGTARAVPAHVGEFLTDMLTVDWFHLERMALFTAARELRIGQGEYGFGKDSAAIAAVDRNMNLLYMRIGAMAAAAEISKAEGALIWGHQLEDWRHLAQVTVHEMDDPALEHAWRHYTVPSTDPAIPPYIPVDPHTDLPVGHLRALPPPPAELLAQAADALTTTALTSYEPAMQAPHTHYVVDAVLPGEATRSWQPGPDTEPGPAPHPREVDLDP